MTGPSIQQVLESHQDSLLALPGVVGTAIGRCDDALCIRVFVAEENQATRGAVPNSLDGYAVRVEVTGRFRAR
jgi:hypothetical protein